MADISDRLDRLQRREEFDRFGRPIRSVPAEPAGPMVTRPAGVDDRLGEVLDAVAAVVSRHPGLSVMVAVADGRAGRPVVRVTERDGGVETGVVVAGAQPGPAVAADPAAQAAAVPSASAPVRADFAGPTREPAYAREAVLAGTPREAGYGTMPARDTVPLPVREAAHVHPLAREAARGVPAGDPVFEAAGRPARVPSYRPPVRETAVPAGDPVFEPAARELAARETAAREAAARGTAARESAEREAAAREPAAREAAAREAAAREAAAREAAARETAAREAAAREAAAREAAAREAAAREAAAREPAEREAAARDAAEREAAARDAAAREGAAREGAAREVNGRHAARHDDRPGFTGDSWHNSLWSKDRAPGGPSARSEPAPRPAPAVTEPVRAEDRSTIPVAEDTSQVVSRLAQLLRENPTLASSWSREAPE